MERSTNVGQIHVDEKPVEMRKSIFLFYTYYLTQIVSEQMDLTYTFIFRLFEETRHDLLHE